MATAARRLQLFQVSLFLLLALLLIRPAPAAAQNALSIVSAGPHGESATLAEANEIRVVFSEPMVALGKIAPVVRAPFFKIVPAVRGTFRWSGTTILIFTPDHVDRLPYATRYTVSIDTTAKAISGRQLARPYEFSFTTPTTRLRQTNWYRKALRYDSPMIVALRFNQPVKPADIAAHLRLTFKPHDWQRPTLTPNAQARLKATDPQGLAQFEEKVADSARAAGAQDALTFTLADTWNKEKFPPAPDLVVFEVTARVPTQSWVELDIDDKVPSPQGKATPDKVQSFTIQAEATFFVEHIYYSDAVDPDRHNPIMFRGEVSPRDLRELIAVADITDPAHETAVKSKAGPLRRNSELDLTRWITLEDAGFDSQPPAHTYAIRIGPTLRAHDGQSLGYPWMGVVENWHKSAFSSFGDGHGVWESTGGAQLPFHARNFQNITQWLAPLKPGELMPTLLMLQETMFRATPPGDGTARKLAPKADVIQSYGLNIAPALDANGHGLAWAAVRNGDPIAKASVWDNNVHATVVQSTNLGITVKDSPQNTLVFVTRLDTGDPVGGARVSIVNTSNATFWSGSTDTSGLVLAPNTPLRDPQRPDKFAFIVTAEKDGDVAYVGSDWNEGIRSWDFGLPYSLHEAEPILRGTVFSDRGVYRLGEEVHLKAILRRDTPDGIHLLAPKTPIDILVRDSRSKVVDKRTVHANDWSTAEWTMTVPPEGALGNYTVIARLRDATATATAQPTSATDTDDAGESPDDGYTPSGYLRRVSGDFLVAAYRRPEFRVDVTLTGDPTLMGGLVIAGAPLKGVVTGRYLFGAPMAKRDLKWTFTRAPMSSVPSAISERYANDSFVFIGCCYPNERVEQLQTADVTLDAKGQKPLDLGTRIDAGLPYAYTLEGEVEDVSRQRLANRTSFVVHPAPWYIGVKSIPYFAEQANGIKTEIVAVTPEGKPAAGVAVHVSLMQTQWHSVRRAEGNGFYSWETTPEEIDAGGYDVTTADTPVPLALTLKNGGFFTLTATAQDDAGHKTTTKLTFYAIGAGYTAWMRYDHNRIDLVPERQTYKPGDEARIMIKSPWEHATALVTMEREGIRSQRQFTLTSTQQSISVPVSEADIPNVYVSVLLIKGRTTIEPNGKTDGKTDGTTNGVSKEDTSDPGKPAFRLGYAELRVADDSKRLNVTVKANKDEYRPATAATVDVAVKDRQGRAAQSEVTLWAVDYGVLSLTGFRAPSVVDSVYLHKSLQVATTDNRQRIISRRVLTPKGADEGGGGGEDAGAGTLRKDFRVLAFWLGSVITDKDGRATTTVKLPESLTTYRIMAVSGDKLSRFGAGDSEIRINKPVLLRAAFPRFLAVGDRAFFGSVINSQLKEPGTATVTMRSLDPSLLEIEGAQQSVEIAANGTAEVRFNGMGRGIGRARVQMTVKLNGESDAFEDVVPVEVLVSPETVAAYGEAKGTPAREALTVPTGVVPTFGGLHVELSSTAMVGLGEGARYLVEYPYGCAEQRGSRALALLLAADLGDAFSLPGIDPKDLRPTVQTTLKDLERYQCPNGGFAYWPGECWSESPYLTSYLLHVFQVARSLHYDVDDDMMDRAYKFLEDSLAGAPAPNEGWWPTYTAWQAFAVKTLVDGGHNEDSHINRLYGYIDRMPVFGLAHLLDAIVAKGEKGARVEELKRRIMNAILPEGGSAHVEELADPYLAWFWSSNTRSTSIVLGAMVRDFGSDAPVRQTVRWLMNAREKGRWGNTQENAWAMESLVAYYRKFEAEVPDFTGVVSFGGDELARDAFKGRSAEARISHIPMKDLVAKAAPGTTRDLTFARDGSAGTLFYATRLQYAADTLMHDPLDAGISIQRRYARLASAEATPDAPATTFKAGDLIRVTLSFTLTKERRFVAVSDPLPAGVEPVESWFATTAADVKQRQQQEETGTRTWRDWWDRGGFDHIERHDDRVLLFATRLAEGKHEFSYIVRATTAGTYRTAPAHVEEMYEPEIFGRTPTALIEVKP